MSRSIATFFTSEPFKFIVDGTTIFVHGDLVSQHSKPLDRMMRGGMKESQEGKANLPDLDAGTFLRFVQWAYNGYYTAADFSSEAESSVSQESGALTNVAPPVYIDSDGEEYELHYNNPVERSGKSAKKSGAYNNYYGYASSSSRPKADTKQELESSFVSRETTVRQTSIAVPAPRKNQDPKEEYTEVFLCHARLYVFAQQYDIPQLKQLALEELQQTLAIFTLYENRTGDIITLLRYIYNPDNTAESEEGVEDLRTLLTHYMGYEMETLMKDPEFSRMMAQDGGPMLHDFMKMVGKRV